jgi:hypothetical protein
MCLAHACDPGKHTTGGYFTPPSEADQMDLLLTLTVIKGRARRVIEGRNEVKSPRLVGLQRLPQGVQVQTCLPGQGHHVSPPRVYRSRA